jgi:Leucine-rich repeat (LRR) protein
LLGKDLDPDFPEKPFRHFEKLFSLFLGNNLFGELPSDLFYGLTELGYLQLANNYSLRSVPENIFHTLSKLQVLYLNGNQIQSIPMNTFNGLNNLTKLDLSNTKLLGTAEQFRIEHNLDPDVEIIF